VAFDYNYGSTLILPNAYLFGFYYASPNGPALVEYDIATDDGSFGGVVVGAGNVTVVNLDDFAVSSTINGNKISWTMLEESGIAGYNVYRDGLRLNHNIIAAANVDATQYFYMDVAVDNATYTLTEIEGSGQEVSLATVEFNANVPSGYELAQNFPNPFNPTTSINFTLAETGNVNLTVYNLVGEPVANLVNDNLDAGTHSVEFNASDLPSGIYFYTLNAGDVHMTRKMSLLK